VIQTAINFDRAPDVCRVYHGGNANSEAANESVQPSKAIMCERILARLAIRPMTCDAMEEETGYSHQSCSARFSELKQAGRIRAIGSALTRSGRNAAVYEVAE